MDFNKEIEIICKQLKAKNNSPRIEYDDLYQEAYLKYLQLKKNNVSKNYMFISIKNHLINYIKKELRPNEISIGLVKGL